MGTAKFIINLRRYIILTDVLMLSLCIWFLLSLPSKLFLSPTSFVLEASNGHLLSAAIASDGQWRFPITDTVPVKFEKCILAFEDKRFYSHPGIDILSLARAMLQNYRAGAVVSGGSTLSMQVIRLSRRQNRTVFQKLVEMIQTFRLELQYSKNEIMGLYAANAPFGRNVVGLEAAAWRYFGRDPATLSWGEMSTLAVLPNSPSLVRPGRNSQRLLIKRNDLLDKLVENGTIDLETASLSKLEPIPGNPLPLPTNAPHLLNRFRTERSQLDLQSTRLQSTLNEQLQLKVNEILMRYNNRYRSNDINNIAALVLEVQSGNVMAYAGNIYEPGRPDLESHVDMIKAPRSPGSTLKPFLYASMLTEGFILPTTLIPDVPTQISGYVPQNYDLGYDGAIPADQALSRSLNIPAVKMLQQYKYERFYGQLKNLGFTTLTQPADHYGLSLILGGSEVTMWDLASAYLGMARTLNNFNEYSGMYNPADFAKPHYFSRKQVDAKKYTRSSYLDYGAIWHTFNAMEEVMRPGDEGLWEQFSSSSRVAWKTGTSFGFRDAWAVGLMPGYVVCVWVGNADGEGRPGLIGVETAAPVLFDIFRQLPQKKWFNAPQTKLIKLKVCKQSGYKASENCPDVIIENVPAAGEKTRPCPYHKLIHMDRTQTYQVTDQCENPTDMVHKSWFILPPTMEYYFKIKHSDYKELPIFKPGCGMASPNATMELIYPKNNASVYIPLEIDGQRGRLILQAAHRNALAKIYWHIDSEYVGTTQNLHQLEITAQPGRHVLTLIDDKGEQLDQIFTILNKPTKK